MKNLLMTFLLIFAFNGCAVTNGTNTTSNTEKTWDELFDSKEWKPINSNQEQNINNMKKAI
ncbi:hypothetical protein GZ989_011365 (plasmid) [Campylobacter fetus]|uniref:Lipoprotein n=1 Tax=Campylobacter fetus TaxID=196 RepID=A0A974RKT5_CAMFE|nr:hypothetical protein [Campylobacter fetus]OCS32902.1 hypothetical protein AWR31_08160 [Campylobacter fetus subsp. venerealis]QMS59905.1 hypothetical protein GZ989_011365 [Campylobacter fetus]